MNKLRIIIIGYNFFSAQGIFRRPESNSLADDPASQTPSGAPQVSYICPQNPKVTDRVREAFFVGENAQRNILDKKVDRTIDRIQAKTGKGLNGVVCLWDQMDKMTQDRNDELPFKNYIKAHNKLRSNSKLFIYLFNSELHYY